MEVLEKLAVALALGLLIGAERGWQERATVEGGRIAGVRTFGLISLLGALWALLAEELGNTLLGLAFLAFAALMTAAHVLDRRAQRDHGITTVVAALMTFALGATTIQGYLKESAAVAVVTTVLLGLKPVLHRGLERLEQRELFAALKLLLISVVLLPVLPNKGYGPWDAINPYVIWWWVVLIAGISFLGYFAVKLMGARRGVLLTGLFGGLASSTAVTLTFARLGRKNRSLQPLLAAGIVVAAGTLFPRVLLEVAIVNDALLPHLLWPMLSMMAVSYIVVLSLWRADGAQHKPQELPLANPFELAPALQFAALLAAVLVLSRAFQQWLGDVGIYLVALFAGISDVDAITLSLARLSRNELPQEVAVRAIVLATIVNTLTKGLIVAVICGRLMGWRVGAVFLATVLAGGAAVYFTIGF